MYLSNVFPNNHISADIYHVYITITYEHVKMLLFINVNAYSAVQMPIGDWYQTFKAVFLETGC